MDSFEHSLTVMGICICILLILIILALSYFISRGSLTVVGDNKFKVIGKFRSLNCDTGQFNFISTTSEEYMGYLDKSIRKGSEKINFIEDYEITISRIIKKEYLKDEVTIIDKIVAFSIS